VGSSDLCDDILRLAVDEGDEGSVATQAKGAELCQGVEGRVRIEERDGLEGGGQARREGSSREVSGRMKRKHADKETRMRKEQGIVVYAVISRCRARSEHSTRSFSRVVAASAGSSAQTSSNIGWSSGQTLQSATIAVVGREVSARGNMHCGIPLTEKSKIACNYSQRKIKMEIRNPKERKMAFAGRMLSREFAKILPPSNPAALSKGGKCLDSPLGNNDLIVGSSRVHWLFVLNSTPRTDSAG